MPDKESIVDNVGAGGAVRQDGPGQKSYSIIYNIKFKICDRGKI
jgi:hypothetical protein